MTDVSARASAKAAAEQARLEKVERKRKIIDLVRLAAQAPDPSLHADQVRSLKVAWREIGLVGRDTPQLALEYKDAVTRFWAAAKGAAAAKEAAAEPTIDGGEAAGQPLPRAEGRRRRRWDITG